MADTLQEMAEALSQDANARVSTATKELSNYEQEREDNAFLEQQYSQLVADVPYAPQVFASPEWAAWKEQLSPGRRQLAESIYADEAKIAIGAFVQDMQSRYSGTQQQQTQQKVDVATTTDNSTEEAAKIKEERERKLQGTTETKTPAGKKGSGPTDPEALFAQFSKEIREQNHLS